MVLYCSNFVLAFWGKVRKTTKSIEEVFLLSICCRGGVCPPENGLPYVFGQANPPSRQAKAIIYL